MQLAGKNIRQLRTAMEVSTRELGDLLHIPDGRIEGWERGAGNPKTQDADTLCNFFGITIETLFEKKLTLTEAEKIIAEKRSGKHSKPTTLIKEEPLELNESHPPLYDSYNLKYIYDMAKLLQIPIDTLLKLQHQEKDNEKLKLLHEVIMIKRELEHLKTDNARLTEINEFLRSKTK